MKRGVFTLAAFGLALALLVPTTARALDVRLEIAPLLMVPVGPFLDSQAATEAQFDTGVVGWNLGTIDLTSLSDVENSTGGGISVALLLGNFEIRYEFGALPWDKQVLTYIGFVTQDLSFYIPTTAADARDGLDEQTIKALFGDESSISRDLSDLDSILFHNIGVGYRFVPFPEWVVQPYVPVGIGFAIAQLRNDLDTLFGFYLQTGVGAQWDATDAFRLGLEMRYNFGAYKAPDISVRSITRAGSATLTTNNSAFDAVMEDFHAVTIRLHASYKF